MPPSDKVALDEELPGPTDPTGRAMTDSEVGVPTREIAASSATVPEMPAAATRVEVPVVSAAEDDEATRVDPRPPRANRPPPDDESGPATERRPMPQFDEGKPTEKGPPPKLARAPVARSLTLSGVTLSTGNPLLYAGVAVLALALMVLMFSWLTSTSEAGADESAWDKIHRVFDW